MSQAGDSYVSVFKIDGKPILPPVVSVFLCVLNILYGFFATPIVPALL